MTMDLARLTALATDLRERAGAVAKPASNRSWFDIKHAKNAGDETVIGIYDEIGERGVSARDFVNELNGIHTQNVTVQIASAGGAVWDGLAIYAALAGMPQQAHGGVATDVVSHAFSAASFIAQAGSPGKRRIRKNARMMVHDPAIGGGVVMGNARQLREFKDKIEEIAAQLDEASSNIASIYAERSGTELAKWKALMEAETFFGADDAVQAGLADEVVTAGGEPQTEQTNKATTEPTLPTSAAEAYNLDELLSSLKGVFQ